MCILPIVFLLSAISSENPIFSQSKCLSGEGNKDQKHFSARLRECT